MIWQLLNVSFWTWLFMSPAEQTRAWFQQWDSESRVQGDTHPKNR